MKYRIVPVVLMLVVGYGWASEPSATRTIEVAPDDMPSHVVKVLRTTNKAQTNRYVPKVYEFKNVNPFDVVRFYRRVMEIEEGRFATFVAPDGKSGLVMVIAPEYQIASLDKLMAELDRPGLTSSSGDELRYIRLKHRAADDIGLLRAIFGQATHSASRPPGGSRAGDLTMIAELETGAIFVYGPPSAVECVEAVLNKLDIPMPQVLVEATMYEIDLNNEGAIGFDYYAWKNGPGRNAFALGAFAEYQKVDRLKGGVDVFNSGFDTHGLPHHRFRNHGYNAAYFLDVPSAYFDFLVEKGKARVITAGSVLSKMPTAYKADLNAFGQAEFDPDADTPALTGGPAEFRANDEVLYYKVLTGPSPRAGARPSGKMLDPFGDDTSFPDNRTVVGTVAPLHAGGTTINQRTIAAVDVGTLLEVTPRIATDSLLLGLHMEVSSLVGFDGAGSPRISARRADTDVRVRDGEEVVYGGMERAVRLQSTRKFPLLGSIPVIGWAFGSENSEVKKAVVVSVIRATRLPSGVPPDMEQVIRQVSSNEPTPLPADRFGFDQWALDRGD
jgi:type II secretory pathway component GspD/PulD (secretin)